MVGIAQDQFAPCRDDFIGRQGFYRSLGADGHKGRGFQKAMRRFKNPEPGAAF